MITSLLDKVRDVGVHINLWFEENQKLKLDSSSAAWRWDGGDKDVNREQGLEHHSALECHFLIRMIQF